jgi:5-methylthioadenosine/S-adenosylhomocysteine deaminase
LLAKNGVKVAHCPTSNMKLSVGAALDLRALLKRGVTVSLGTDGASSNNNLDMFESMKFAALLQKFSTSDPTALPAKEAMRMATSEGAKALRLNAGEIKAGALADIALINLRAPELTPSHHLTSDLVYSANGGCVDTVICDGRILMAGRRIEGEEKILEQATKSAARLTGA